MSGTDVGVRPHRGGHQFRLWAPHASEVRVRLQTGASWDRSSSAREVDLDAEGNGYWSAVLANVAPGTLYRFVMTVDGSPRPPRLDPAARDVIHSGLTRFDPDNGNASIVPHPDLTPWAEFTTPAFENFIIYQLHMGSFAGRNDGLTERMIAGFEHVQTKFGYIRELGFNAVALLPVHEFSSDRSWGYNPGAFFAPESAYGTPSELRTFVDAAHRAGLAVIFDVVYNHAGPQDNVLWNFDGVRDEGGIYFEGGQMTPWGRGPAWWKREVRDYFLANALMFLEDYRGDGLRFDATTQMNGAHLAQVVDELRRRHPSKLIIAEHLPAHPWITTAGRFCATWFARPHHECQRALTQGGAVDRVSSFLGWDGFDHAWNLVKYTLGSHDDCGDQEHGDAEHGLSNPDARHRYLVDLLGGRHDGHARAKCRLAWVLNVAMPGTPMLFMGSECHMGAPNVAWGYWHDGVDDHGDHRFDWSIAGDAEGMTMRRLVAAANHARWAHPALRSDTLHIVHRDPDNQVLAFKRWSGPDVILTVVHFGDHNFTGHAYGVHTGGQRGRWTQILCSQDAAFGGWDGAGNAYHEPWAQDDGRIYVNLPRWSALMFRLSER